MAEELTQRRKKFALNPSLLPPREGSFAINLTI